jgi:hypothetical protein
MRLAKEALIVLLGHPEGCMSCQTPCPSLQTAEKAVYGGLYMHEGACDSDSDPTIGLRVQANGLGACPT